MKKTSILLLCLLLFSIINISLVCAAPVQVAGEWVGKYYYSAKQSVDFQGSIQQNGTSIKGTLSEPRTTFGPRQPFITSTITGTINGNVVSFLKVYDYSKAHTVEYSGDYNTTTKIIKGKWHLHGASGYFEINIQ